jgi:hypothetical protein
MDLLVLLFSLLFNNTNVYRRRVTAAKEIEIVSFEK